MKYSDSFKILKTAVQAINDPKLMANNPVKNFISNFTDNQNSNNNMKNNVFGEPNDSNIEFNKDDSIRSNNTNTESQYSEESKLLDNKNREYSNVLQDNSSGSQGIIDSIINQLTSVRLQQAIILSEIVGKPRSKTRKRRRF
ncbi:MAG: hypothetical protein AB6733_07025 [Clostridiaceae bacterium]